MIVADNIVDNAPSRAIMIGQTIGSPRFQDVKVRGNLLAANRNRAMPEWSQQPILVFSDLQNVEIEGESADTGFDGPGEWPQEGS
jgi:hypothetical protein